MIINYLNREIKKYFLYLKERTEMQGIKILGTGRYVPEAVITNKDFEKIIDTSDEWIKTRTGVSERHLAKNTLNFRMGAAAAEKALENAGVKADELDLIIVSTCTPDFFCPSASCLIQHCIGAKNAACFDVNSACTGFITAVDTARNFLASGDYKKVLVIASEYLTRMVDYEDRGSCILFGDGAGAVVVEAADTPYYSCMGAQGDLLEALYSKVNYTTNVPFEGFGDPFAADSEVAEKLDTYQKNNFMQMDGKAVYKFAVDAMSKSVARVCEKAGITTEDLDLVVPHQANIRIISSALKAMKITDEKIYVNLDKHGNTSSSCMPICLDELFEAGKLKRGMKICLVGFGAGLTFGAIIFEY